MTIDLYIAYLLLFIALLLFGFALAYFFFIYEKEKEFEEKEEKIFSNYKDIMKHAHHQARTLLDQAGKKAQRLLTTTDYINKDIEQKLDDSLEEVVTKSVTTLDDNSAKLAQDYEKTVKKVENAYVEEMKQLLTRLTSATEGEIKSFTDTLRTETLDAQRFIGDKLTSDFEQTRKEIDAYKKQQLAQIDEKIKTVVQEVSEDVLRKAITLPDHETLIKEALEKAKKEGLFSV